ncbi:DUF6843 domain-containing protein [Pseudoalteromonas rhizosphaerae]|uniref:DUF6843 domain-containing protein n=1 Tax=Pseudoalteromonas rhizosphaerae TaxID=2518973 RepID=UPI00384CD875
MKLIFKAHFLKILFFGSMISLLSACTEVKKSEPVIYLIPENYVGSLYIIFNAPNGHPPKYEDGSRVYEIPPSGILVTQMDANEGWIENSQIQYFEVSNTNERTPISEDSSLKDKDTTDGEETRTVYVGGLGESGPIYGCTVINQNFTVGTDAEQTDRKNLFSIYDAIKRKNIDEKLFNGMCKNSKNVTSHQ